MTSPTRDEVRAAVESAHASLSDPMPGTGLLLVRPGVLRTLIAAAEVGEKAWVPVGERMPRSGQWVLAASENSVGKHRVIRAFWAAKHTLEYSGEDCDTADDWVDYAPEDGNEMTPYCPEGWYECNDNEETNWYVTDKVTHWMPLPEPPEPDAAIAQASPTKEEALQALADEAQARGEYSTPAKCEHGRTGRDCNVCNYTP